MDKIDEKELIKLIKVIFHWIKGLIYLEKRIRDKEGSKYDDCDLYIKGICDNKWGRYQWRDK